MSITNQKAMLKENAEKNGMLDHAYYVVDGFTGRNFNLPSFQRMVADIEAGKVNCVITKDLLRLGRHGAFGLPLRLYKQVYGGGRTATLDGEEFSCPK